MALNNPSEENSVTFSDTTDDEVLNTIGGSFNVLGKKRVLISIGISGGSVIAFDQFALQGRVELGVGSWLAIQAAWGTTEEDAKLVLSPVVLETLAHGASSFALVHIEGFEEIRCQSAQAGVTASAVTRALTIRILS